VLNGVKQRFLTCGLRTTSLPGGPQARPTIYLILTYKYANRQI